MPEVKGQRFRPDPGMIRVSDFQARELDRQMDAYFDRMAGDDTPDLPVQECVCGELFRGPAGYSCWRCTRLDNSRSNS